MKNLKCKHYISDESCDLINILNISCKYSSVYFPPLIIHCINITFHHPILCLISLIPTHILPNLFIIIGSSPEVRRASMPRRGNVDLDPIDIESIRLSTDEDMANNEWYGLLH